MRNILDLRKKVDPEIRVIEKFVVLPRSKFKEFMRVFLGIIVVTATVWGLSHADDLNPFSDGFDKATSNFSVIGIAGDITEKTLSVTDAHGSDKSGNTSYTLNLSHLDKIETADYAPLIVSDIHTGDKIIAQGLTDGSTFFIKRIVSFTSVASAVVPTTDEVATSTATTTLETDISTSTPDEVSSSTPEVTATTTDVATSTEATTTDAVSSSTPEVTPDQATTTIIDSLQNTAAAVIDAVKEVVNNVVDTVTGNNTPTTDEAPPTPEPTN